MSVLTCPQEKKCGAMMSPCGRYRYQLWRNWGDGPAVCWIGLNPSVADAKRDDPTLLRMVDFSRRWRFGKLYVVNLFAMVATDPSRLSGAEDPVGPDADAYIRSAVECSVTLVVCWGAFKAPARVAHILDMLHGRRIHCLGRNADGSPKHPLYLPKVTSMRIFQEDWA